MATLTPRVRSTSASFPSSPEFVRISIAAALTLGLQSGGVLPRNIGCTCIDLLLTYPVGCGADCAYCGMAKSAGKRADEATIELSWPLYRADEVFARIVELDTRGEIGRVCVGQVVHPHAFADTLAMVTSLRTVAPRLPLTTLVCPGPLHEPDLVQLRDSGVDIIGIGLDAASESVFVRTRGFGVDSPHSWEDHWRVARLARRIFGPFRVNLHLIVGLGETDRELIELFYQLRDEQIAASLFAFDPLPGSTLQDVPRAPLVRHRRIQLVKFLIERRDLPREALSFDEAGALKRLDAPTTTVEAAIATGKPFMTEGCPDRRGGLACNRPYGTYRPGEPFRDYPYPPTIADVGVIRGQVGFDELHD